MSNQMKCGFIAKELNGEYENSAELFLVLEKNQENTKAKRCGCNIDKKTYNHFLNQMNRLLLNSSFCDKHMRETGEVSRKCNMSYPEFKEYFLTH